MAPAAVARRALDQVGLTEQRVPMGADAQSAARQAETAIRPGLLEECEWRLLATAQVQAQVEKLRQHATEQQGEGNQVLRRLALDASIFGSREGESRIASLVGSATKYNSRRWLGEIHEDWRRMNRA